MNPILFCSLGPIQDNFILAINQEYIDEEIELTLNGGEEIAVIPPISGG